MSFATTAALFLITSLLLLPVNGCIGPGCATVAAAVGIGVAARVGIAIGVIAVVAIVVLLIIRRRRQQQQLAAQQNGMRPYDIEGGNNPSQSTVTGNTFNGQRKTSMDNVPI